ncbi:MAG TPA: crosslink repair DNA glycosylase YcaQ family protein [Chloroflexia bacterium]|nr:crosslink repair DNA glycosylase YcaQ family protein [Chloroflexia bacterium]
MHLSHSAARALMLAAQGLDRRSASPPTKDDVLAAIRRMQAVQIDTIHVVARSPYLVLWSRLGHYKPEWLDELLAEGKLFEFWSHAASILPIEDYPLYRRHMLDHAYRFFHSAPSWIKRHPEAVEHVLAYVREHGEVRSSDFERTDGQQSGWFNWKEEKIALEALHTTGVLMIARRHNFHRVYALRERVLPDWDDSQAPPIDEVKRALTLKAVRALGVTPREWVPDYFRTVVAGTEKLLKKLAGEGQLLTVEVEGWKNPGYVHPDNAALLESAAAGGLTPALTTFLSPFDPLVWDRTRCKAMFDFDYRIECYTPEAKRRYGYFTLPILRRGQLIGRLDAKAHRGDGLFEVKSLHLEPGVRPDDALIDDVAGALLECAAWHNTPEVVVRRSDPPDLAAVLEDAAGSRAA